MGTETIVSGGARQGGRRPPAHVPAAHFGTHGCEQWDDDVVIPWHDGPGVVEFPDGRKVRGRGLRKPLPTGQQPEFGLYLLARNPRSFEWEHRWVKWPDFRTPVDTVEALDALRQAYGRAATERVEIACGGGVGRTGSGLAVMAVMAGMSSAHAIEWVRCHYNRRAVETPWQRRWVRKSTT